MDENILNPPINLTEEEKIVWDEFLAKMGVEEVYYYSIRDKFLKHYGYFIKN